MNERRDIEITIIASLLKKPELVEKLRVNHICLAMKILEFYDIYI